MPSKETEKEYSELRKRLKLPDFKELDNEFEISDMDETNFFLRAIIRRIAEKLDFYTTMIEEILQPDTSSLYAMHEIRNLDENEKKRVYEAYARLMNFNRQSIEISISHNENEEAEFIKNVNGEWKAIKPELLKFVKNLRASWNAKEADIKEDLRYLG